MITNKLIKPLLNLNLSRPETYNSKPRNPNLIWLDKNECLDPSYNAFTYSIFKNLSLDAMIKIFFNRIDVNHLSYNTLFCLKLIKKLFF